MFKRYADGTRYTFTSNNVAHPERALNGDLWDTASYILIAREGSVHNTFLFTKIQIAFKPVERKAIRVTQTWLMYPFTQVESSEHMAKNI